MIVTKTGTVRLLLRAESGQTTLVNIDLAQWHQLSPSGKVIALHDIARPILKGRPFDILKQEDIKR